MTGKIFLSYRRGDDPGFAGRLFDQLQNSFQPEQLFMDVDSIQPGDDFIAVLEDQIAKSDILLAIIGRGWLDARGTSGRRLDDPQDFVRIEIATALRLNKLVVPVLVNGATMPAAEALPGDLKALVRRQASKLGHERFRAEAQSLIAALGRAMTEAAAKAGATVASPPPTAELGDAERERGSWEKVRVSGSEAELRAHLARFPGGAHESAARTALEAVLWERIQVSRKDKALLDYLEQFPGGPRADTARSRLRESRSAKISALMADSREAASVTGYFFTMIGVVFLGVIACVYAFLAFSKGLMPQFWGAIIGAVVSCLIFVRFR